MIEERHKPPKEFWDWVMRKPCDDCTDDCWEIPANHCLKHQAWLKENPAGTFSSGKEGWE